MLWHLNTFGGNTDPYRLVIVVVTFRSSWLIESWSAFWLNRSESCRKKRKENRSGNGKVHA